MGAAIFNTPFNSDIARIFGSSEITEIICDKLGQIVYASKDLDFVQKAIVQCKDWVNNKFTKFKLAPLHLAAMKGRADVASTLLQNGALIDIKDFKNFAPLHHAAMFGKQLVVDLLVGAGANEKALNYYGGTYQDIQRLTRQRVDVAYSMDTYGNPVNTAFPNFDPTCLKPNVTLVTENMMTPQQVLNVWAKGLSKQYHDPMMEHLQPALHKAYSAFKEHPPILHVNHITHDDSGKPVAIPSNPCGVFAGQTFKTGQIINEYKGLIVDTNPADVTYLLEPVDGGPYRNEGPMMNDAFPNSRMVFIHDADGMESRHVLIALEEIHPGQEITWNYQLGDATKFSGHIELRPEAMKKFLSKHSWQELAKCFYDVTKESPNLETYATFIRKWQGMNYLLHTPSTFLRLMEEGTIDNKAMLAMRQARKLGWQKVQSVGPWMVMMDKVFQTSSHVEKKIPDLGLGKQVAAIVRESLAGFNGLVTTHASIFATIDTALVNLKAGLLKADTQAMASALLKELESDLKNTYYFDMPKAQSYLMKNWRAELTEMLA